jgi:hypothetical protein
MYMVKQVVSSNPVHGEVYSIQHYVNRLVSDIRQVSGFLRVLRLPPAIKLTATIWLKVALSTLILTQGIPQQPGTGQIACLTAFFPWLLCFQK